MAAQKYGVAIQTPDGSWWMPTVDQESVQFLLAAPGGCETAQVTLLEPGKAPEFSTDAPIVITKASSGKRLWTGRVSIPGATATGKAKLTAGTLGAVGNVADLAAREYLAPYMVTRADAWAREWHSDASSTPKTTTEIGAVPNVDDTQALVLTTPPGAIINQHRVVMGFLPFEDAGWKVGGVGGRIDFGHTDSDWTAAIFVGPISTFYTAASFTADSGAHTFSHAVTGAGLNQSRLMFHFRFTGAATTTTNENMWAALWLQRVIAEMWLRDGTTRRTVSTTLSILASDVVEDIMGRWLGGVCDTASSEVTATTALIKTLDYSQEPVTIRTILDDLLTFEPSFYWTWGVQDESGKSTLDFRAWPVSPRYLVPAVDGVTVTEPGGESPLADRVSITYRWRVGRVITKTYIADRTQYPDVAALPASGRAAPTVDLPDAFAEDSAAAADILGPAILAQVAVLPDAAHVDIDPGVPIIDLTTGAVIDPDEMQPGYAVHVQALGRAARLTELDVQGGGASLTLGRPPKTTDQILTEMQTQRRRRK